MDGITATGGFWLYRAEPNTEVMSVYHTEIN
jgi:hypothetical protein